MRKHKINMPKSCTKFPPKYAGWTTASYIKEFDRLNQLKPVRYVNNDYN